MLKSFTQTVATPRKWPGRARPRPPASATSTHVPKPAGTSRPQSARTGRRHRRPRRLRVALARRADTRPGQPARSNCAGLTKSEATTTSFSARAAWKSERWPACRAPIVGTSPTLPRGNVELGDRPGDLHVASASVASGESLVEVARARAALVDRSAVRCDCLPVAARDRAGQLEPVLDRALHQRLERLRRRARIRTSSEAARCSVTRIVRCEHRARVVERARRVGKLERPQPERLREPAAPSRAPLVSAVTAAHAPSSCSGPRARVNVWSG